jgi:hypothetical protein
VTPIAPSWVVALGRNPVRERIHVRPVDHELKRGLQESHENPQWPQGLTIESSHHRTDRRLFRASNAQGSAIAPIR